MGTLIKKRTPSSSWRLYAFIVYALILLQKKRRAFSADDPKDESRGAESYLLASGSQTTDVFLTHLGREVAGAERNNASALFPLRSTYSSNVECMRWVVSEKRRSITVGFEGEDKA
ncbi:hypothetical protein Bca52824_026319 [Brassica carinata]|uniref:Uncharacterized protein n=1 Tax=Brassica carinata TaxID=52824 RepID=A0A8X7V9V9_BRACI|nr:hypothetical protein Bca52824_026319 [Brassica carinata]